MRKENFDRSLLGRTEPPGPARRPAGGRGVGPGAGIGPGGRCTPRAALHRGVPAPCCGWCAAQRWAAAACVVLLGSVNLANPAFAESLPLGGHPLQPHQPGRRHPPAQ